MKEREFYKKMLDRDFTPDFRKISEDIADDKISDIHAENREKIKIRRGGAAAVCAAVCLSVFVGTFALARSNDLQSGDTIENKNSEPSAKYSQSDNDLSVSDISDKPTIMYLIENSNSIVQLKVLDTDGEIVSDLYGDYRQYTVSEYTNWYSRYDTEFDKKLYGFNRGNDTTMNAYLPAGENDDINLETDKTYLIFVNNESLDKSDYLGLFELENGTAEKISGEGSQQFALSELYFAKRQIQYGSSEKDVKKIDYSDQKPAYTAALNAAGEYLEQCGIESCTLSQPFECNNSDGTKCDELGFFILNDGKIYGNLTVKSNEASDFDVTFNSMEIDVSEWNNINGPFAFVIDDEGKTMVYRSSSDVDFWQHYGFDDDNTDSVVYTCDIINMGDVCAKSDNSQTDNKENDVTEEPAEYKLIPDGENKFVSEDGVFTVEYEVACDSEKAVVNMTVYNNTDDDMIINNASDAFVGINGEYDFDIEASNPIEEGIQPEQMPVMINISKTSLRANSKFTELYTMNYSEWIESSGNSGNKWYEGKNNTLYISYTPIISVLDGDVKKYTYQAEQPAKLTMESPAETENTSSGEYLFLQDVNENDDRPVYEFNKTGESTYSSPDGAFRAETWLEYDGEQVKLYVYYHNDTDYDLVAGEPYSPVIGINSDYTAETETEQGYMLGEFKAHTSYRKTYTLRYEDYIYPNGNRAENDKQFNMGQNKWNDNGLNVINIKFKIGLSLKGAGDVNGCSYVCAEDVTLSYEI